MSSSPSILSKLFGRPKAPIPRSQLIKSQDAVKAVIPLGRQWIATEISVGPDEADLRLDRFITSKYDISRSLLQKLLRKHMIKLERPDYTDKPGRMAEPHQIFKIPASCSVRVQLGDVISLSEVFLKDRTDPVKISLEDIGSESVEKLRSLILYKDENLIVINKPSGLAVHGGPGTTQHLEMFLNAFKFDYYEAPRLIHRLDKDTSGLLILARTRKAATNLMNRFKESSVDKSVKKLYWAMVNGVPAVKEGRIITNIYKTSDERMTSIANKRVDVMDEGKVAITRFRNAGLYIKAKPQRTKLSLIEFQPLTGRTHQIRVHASEQLGTPILGDIKYGRSHLARKSTLHLHARTLVLNDYPEPGKSMTFKAPIPRHFVRTINDYPLFLRKKPKFPKKKLHNLSAVVRK